MFARTDDLNGMLLEARSVRARWMVEAQYACECNDADREVACEYQICLVDGLIALLQRELIH